MLRTFRKYHRTLALIACLPLIVTVISGVGYTIMGEWFHQDEIGEFLLSLHTFEIIHLEKKTINISPKILAVYKKYDSNDNVFKKPASVS
jgi:hypothetical protein